VTGALAFQQAATSGEINQDQRQFFLSLYPKRDKYIEQIPGRDWEWRTRFLRDAQLLGVISDEGRGLFRGSAWAHKTRFAVFDIDPGSRYQTAQELQKLTSLLAAVGLTAKPYQSSSRGGWHLYLFFDDWADSDEVKNTLKAWLKAHGYQIQGGTLEVFPSGNGLRFPLQHGFGWLDQNGELTKRREDLEQDEALAAFLIDMDANARNWDEARRRITSQLFSAGTSAGAGVQEHKDRVGSEGFEQLYTTGLDHELYQRGREYWLNGLTASGQRHDAIVSIGHYLWYGDVSLGLRALPSPRNAGARAELISAWLQEKHNGQSKTINAGGWSEVLADIQNACSWTRQGGPVREKESYPLTDRLVNRLVETKTLTPEDFAKANRRKEGAARAKIRAALNDMLANGKHPTIRGLAKATGCDRDAIRRHSDIWMTYAVHPSTVELSKGRDAYRGAGGEAVGILPGSLCFEPAPVQEKKDFDLLDQPESEEPSDFVLADAVLDFPVLELAPISFVVIDSLRLKTLRSDGEQLNGNAGYDLLAATSSEFSSGVNHWRKFKLNLQVGEASGTVCSLNGSLPTLCAGPFHLPQTGFLLWRSALAPGVALGNGATNFSMGASSANLTATGLSLARGP